ncbi:MAG: hypothetical protein IKB81_04600 [Paludibacteraceae bacterium]|nr:hypothetical protein [Paludibacteraceae bacterium]
MHSCSAILRIDCRYATLGARCLHSILEATGFSDVIEGDSSVPSEGFIELI